MVNNDSIVDTESLESDMEIESNETGLTIQQNSVRSISDSEFRALSIKNNYVPMEYHANTLPPHIRKNVYKSRIHDENSFSSDSELHHHPKARPENSKPSAPTVGSDDPIVITDDEDEVPSQPSVSNQPEHRSELPTPKVEITSSDRCIADLGLAKTKVMDQTRISFFRTLKIETAKTKTPTG